MPADPVDTSVGPNGVLITDFLEQFNDEDLVPFIPGDSFSLPGLSQKPGLTLIEAKAEKMPPYDERDEEVYDDDFDTQLRVIIRVDKSTFGKDGDSLKSAAKEWVKGDRDDIKIIREETIKSEKEFQEVSLTVLLNAWDLSDFIGEVTDSLFYENFWNKYMNDIITEGVCYSDKKVPESLEKALKASIDNLAKNTPVDYHPKSNDIVRDLVHPALYPYIKDISKLKKKIKPEKNEEEMDFWGRKYEDSKFQWLPSPFLITKERRCKIQEYINNLDRNAFPDLYLHLESLFEVILPYFEEVWSYAKAMEFFAGDDDDFDWDDAGKYEPLNKEKVDFADKELQVIVKIVEYTLQPGQTYEGVWHAEGMSHENIVMTGTN